MMLIRESDVPARDAQVVFAHSRVKAVGIAVAAVVASVGLSWLGWSTGSGLAAYCGALIGVTLLIFQRYVWASFRDSNWTVLLGDNEVFIRLRSYLNDRAPDDGPAVLVVPYQEIRRVGAVFEQSERPSPDGTAEGVRSSSIVRQTWLQCDVTGDTEPLRRELAAERERRPWGRAFFKHFPVRVVARGVMQIDWGGVSPGIDRCLDLLRGRVPVADAVSTSVDLTDLRNATEEERRRGLQTLVASGDAVTAVTLVRQLYGVELAQARTLVDDLDRLPTRAERPAAPDMGALAAPRRPRTDGRVGWFLGGASVSVAATYPIAMICAWCFRFPIPLGGYVSGPGTSGLVLVAVTFYGVVFGGFVVQAVLGGLAGLLARRRGAPFVARLRCGTYAVAASIPGVLFLATLDAVIGPW